MFLVMEADGRVWKRDGVLGGVEVILSLGSVKSWRMGGERESEREKRFRDGDLRCYYCYY